MFFIYFSHYNSFLFPFITNFFFLFFSYHLFFITKHTNLYFRILIFRCFISINCKFHNILPHIIFPTDTQKRQQTNYFTIALTSKTFTFSCLIQLVCFLSFSLSQTEAFLPLFSSIFILLNCGSLSLSLSYSLNGFVFHFFCVLLLFIFYTFILAIPHLIVNNFFLFLDFININQNIINKEKEKPKYNKETF